MTLQARILEALGEHALKPRALYEALSTDSPAAIDCGLGALLRARKVSLEFGFYQRRDKRAQLTAASTESTHEAAPESPQQTVTVPVVADSKADSKADPEMQRCRRCTIRKLLTDFPLSNLGNGSRLKTCTACMAVIVRKPRGPRKQTTLGAAAARSAGTERAIPPAIVDRLLKPLHKELLTAVETLERDLAERRGQLRDVEELIQAGGAP